MRKALAELIAGMIPGKMARNRWRGILRYGLRDYLRLRRRAKTPGPEPEVGLAVCAIAKDEGKYLKEWIEWHRSKGVERFYFYDNGSEDNTPEVLKPYIDSGLVVYTFFPGYRRQIAAYDDCMRRHRMEARWIAFIDIDEFIVPLADTDIPAFLNRHAGASAVEINWLVFGSGALQKADSRPVMERFKRHSVPDHRLNRHVKSIVDPRKTVAMTGCHEAARLCGITVDSHGNPVTRNFREREPQQDVIRINHYAVKSREEFAEKQGRGRASGRKRSVPDAYFAEYDLNDMTD